MTLIGFDILLIAETRYPTEIAHRNNTYVIGQVLWMTSIMEQLWRKCDEFQQILISFLSLKQGTQQR